MQELIHRLSKLLVNPFHPHDGEEVEPIPEDSGHPGHEEGLPI